MSSELPKALSKESILRVFVRDRTWVELQFYNELHIKYPLDADSAANAGLRAAVGEVQVQKHVQGQGVE